VGQITPTQTTCTQFTSDTAPTLSQLNYSVNKAGKIGQISPGVFFYWVEVAASAGSNTFHIDQTVTSNYSHFFAQANGSFVWTTGCVKVDGTTSINTTAGDTTITFIASAAGTYVIGVKYDSGSVAGFTAPNPTTVGYTFTLRGFSSSEEGLDLVKK
jgi:hypothetical protein